MTFLTCATWNVHRAVGTDGRHDPDRVMDALEQAVLPHGPDILALQEADTDCPPHARIFDVERISQASGLTYQHETPSLRWGPESDGFLGTILWVHPKYVATNAVVIDLPGHCHRGVIAVEFADAPRPFRVISGHFSLGQILRVAQMRVVGQYLRRRPAMQTILLGDFNEWRPWGGFAFSEALVSRQFAGPVRATFPSQWPVLPLDRILCDRAGAVHDLRVIRRGLTKVASDHLPLIATVRLVNGDV